MKKCPKCKFFVADQVAVCKYCGLVLDGTGANDSRESRGSIAAVALETERGSSVRPAAQVHRAGDKSVRPGVSLPPEQAAGMSITKKSGRSSAPNSINEFYDTPRGRAENRVPAEGEDDTDGLVLQRQALYIGVLILMALIGWFVVRPLVTDSGSDRPSRSNQWVALGPPRLPFVVELPAEAVGATLRPIEDPKATALMVTIGEQVFVVGSAPLPGGALEGEPDPYLQSVAEIIGAAQNLKLVEGAGRTSAFGRVFAGSLTSGSPTADGPPPSWGLVHVGLHDQLVYFVVAITEGESGDLRGVFDRIVASIQ